MSANVSGFLGTTRISLNDNLLKRTTLPEIRAVMSHEMGHYVLNHIFKMILEFAVIVVIGFFLIRSAMNALVPRFGARWGVREIGDIASLPLFLALATTFLFAVGPVTRTLIRQQEAEADLFGLNAAREPDGFAEVTLKLTEYRKPDPGPIEEILFFDHPSARSRIRMAMRWKAENP